MIYKYNALEYRAIGGWQGKGKQVQVQVQVQLLDIAAYGTYDRVLQSGFL